ncbi:MAG: hypothetical protein M1822_002856 [Bathelium mastoideum]|nr:MAG: hypothetical protein M1822_002856 [Bathelium mastoideum]
MPPRASAAQAHRGPQRLQRAAKTKAVAALTQSQKTRNTQKASKNRRKSAAPVSSDREEPAKVRPKHARPIGTADTAAVKSTRKPNEQQQLSTDAPDSQGQTLRRVARTKARRPSISPELIKVGRPDHQAGSVIETTERVLPETLANEPPRSTSTGTTSADSYWWIEPGSEQRDWYRRKGFLPPLDLNTLDAVRLVLGRESAFKMGRLKSDDATFQERLSTERNVHMEPDISIDAMTSEIKDKLVDLPDSAASKLYSRLWTADVDNCKGENEALFQRTVMISFLDRHRLIFNLAELTQGVKRSNEIELGKRLAFSTEADWKCDPMPTRACRLPRSILFSPPQNRICACRFEEKI